MADFNQRLSLDEKTLGLASALLRSVIRKIKCGEIIYVSPIAQEARAEDLLLYGISLNCIISRNLEGMKVNWLKPEKTVAV